MSLYSFLRDFFLYVLAPLQSCVCPVSRLPSRFPFPVFRRNRETRKGREEVCVCVCVGFLRSAKRQRIGNERIVQKARADSDAF
jgi:hypothetical protein